MDEFVGSRISLITNAFLRYEGVLEQIDAVRSTVCLKQVECFGTEDREAPAYVPAKSDLEPFMVFSGEDIHDLTIITDKTEEVEANNKKYVVYEDIPQVPTYGDNTANQPIGSYDANPYYQMQGAAQPTHNNYPHPSLAHPHTNNANTHHNPNRRNANNSNNRNRGYGAQGNNPNAGGRPNRSYGGAGDKNRAAMDVANIKEAGDFDFTSNNSKFEKETTASTAPVPNKYDKATSFFDSLSCEALNKLSRGTPTDMKMFREKQKIIDHQTFGEYHVSAHQRGKRHYHNQRRNQNNPHQQQHQYQSGGHHQGNQNQGGNQGGGSYQNYYQNNNSYQQNQAHGNFGSQHY